MTLIDRDIIIEEMLKETQKLKTNENAMTNCCSNITNGIIKWLQAYPIITDVAEVRHGKWEWRELYDIKGFILVCSECRESDGACERFNFCPNCGAKMDEKGEK
jgi:hypothetical protein